MQDALTSLNFEHRDTKETCNRKSTRQLESIESLKASMNESQSRLWSDVELLRQELRKGSS